MQYLGVLEATCVVAARKQREQRWTPRFLLRPQGMLGPTIIMHDVTHV